MCTFKVIPIQFKIEMPTSVTDLLTLLHIRVELTGLVDQVLLKANPHQTKMSCSGSRSHQKEYTGDFFQLPS
jgi:hypothetical protein